MLLSIEIPPLLWQSHARALARALVVKPTAPENSFCTSLLSLSRGGLTEGHTMRRGIAQAMPHAAQTCASKAIAKAIAQSPGHCHGQGSGKAIIAKAIALQKDVEPPRWVHSMDPSYLPLTLLTKPIFAKCTIPKAKVGSKHPKVSCT